MYVSEAWMADIWAPAMEKKGVEGFHIGVCKPVSFFYDFIEMLFHFRCVSKQGSSTDNDIFAVLEHRCAPESYIPQQMVDLTSKGGEIIHIFFGQRSGWNVKESA